MRTNQAAGGGGKRRYKTLAGFRIKVALAMAGLDLAISKVKFPPYFL